MLARLLALIALVSVLTGCVSATDAPLVRAEPNTTPGVIIRVEGDGTARTDAFTLDGSYDVHWSWRVSHRGGPNDCRPSHCLFHLELMTTGHDLFSSVTLADRYDHGSGVEPGWQRGKYYLHMYAPEGGHWTVEIRDT